MKVDEVKEEREREMKERGDEDEKVDKVILKEEEAEALSRRGKDL